MPPPKQNPWGPISRQGGLYTLSAGDPSGVLPDKRFDFSNGLGAQFTVAGHSILSAPVNVKYELNSGSAGVQNVLPTVVSHSQLSQGKAVVTWARLGLDPANQADFSGSVTIEREGTLIYKMDVTLKGGQRLKKLSLNVPIAPQYVKHLLKQPHPNTYNAQDLSSGSWSYTWGLGLTNGDYSFYFPRALCIHNGDVGLEWAIETDENYAGFAGASNASITVDSVNGLTINICNAAWPFSNPGTKTLSYTWILTPCPPRGQSSVGSRPGRAGNVGSESPALGEFNIQAEECPNSKFTWQGSTVRRNAAQWDIDKAAANARGQRYAAYTIFGNWPEIAPGFQNSFKSAYQGSGGFLNYRADCNPANPTYALVPTDARNADYRAHVLGVWTAALAYSDGLYFDTTNIAPVEYYIDGTGVGRYFYDILGKRQLAKSIAEIAWANGVDIVSHATQSMLAAIPFFDYEVPGEQYRAAIEATVGGDRRRWYTRSLPAWVRESEFCPKVYGQNFLVLPQTVPGPSKTFTVLDQNADTCTCTNHGQPTGQGVTASTTGSLPPGLSSNLLYYARSVSSNSLSFHTTYAGAVNDTNRVNITGNGSGTHTLTPAFAVGGVERLHTEGFLAVCMLHNCGTWHSFTESTAVADLWQGLVDSEAIEDGLFVQYDDTSRLHIADTPTSNVLLSQWITEGKVAVVVVNFNDTATTAALEFNQTVGNPVLLSAGSGISYSEGITVAHEAEVEGSGASWTVTVAENNYALVEFDLLANPSPTRGLKVIDILGFMPGLALGGGVPAQAAAGRAVVEGMV
jgi:hypothetical protein